jgi:hypothetical protein
MIKKDNTFGLKIFLIVATYLQIIGFLLLLMWLNHTENITFITSILMFTVSALLIGITFQTSKKINMSSMG